MWEWVHVDFMALTCNHSQEPLQVLSSEPDEPWVSREGVTSQTLLHQEPLEFNEASSVSRLIGLCRGLLASHMVWS